MDADASPFPNAETTPPVTNMYLVMLFISSLLRNHVRARNLAFADARPHSPESCQQVLIPLHQFSNAFQILRCINTKYMIFREANLDFCTMLQRAQLLKVLQRFQRGRSPRV